MGDLALTGFPRSSTPENGKVVVWVPRGENVVAGLASCAIMVLLENSVLIAQLYLISKVS